ncbi:AraC family transcriptional regulator [Mucilaginibacter kameinonensis]|uniref:AraC family transcriptional regulator n=1 Tax=Mucilaginibacter kameinonensis TaxID=452286 RepID=UPI000EF844E4|nr:helix-turn-helix domain-containing protein [Mucilaginibacter kameinonensis]
MSILPFKSKIGQEQILKISPFKEVIKPTVPHKHAGYFELIVLSDGAGEHVIDDIIYEVNPPMIFFLKPGQTHCWNFTRIPKGYVVLFKEELLDAQLLALVYQLNILIDLQDSRAYMQLLALFHEEYAQTQTEIPVLMAYMRLLLEKTAALSGKGPKPPANALYYQFKSLLHNTDAGAKNVKDYADELNVSTHQLIQVCREANGKTPSMMLTERLLLEAKTLLSATDHPIKEIAHVLHFTDTSHFVKFFKTNTNLTPGAYRELSQSRH